MTLVICSDTKPVTLVLYSSMLISNSISSSIKIDVPFAVRNDLDIFLMSVSSTIDGGSNVAASDDHRMTITVMITCS
jgi:hypothetical protein